MKKRIRATFRLMVFVGFLIGHGNVKAQKSDNLYSVMEKNSISGNFLGSSSLVGITYERIISQKIIFEAGVGLIGIGAGISYYPFNISVSKLCPYIGTKFSTFILVDVGGGYIGYMPFGITLFSKNRVNFGMDIGPAYGKWSDSDFLEAKDPDKIIYIYGNLKVGIRF